MDHILPVWLVKCALISGFIVLGTDVLKSMAFWQKTGVVKMVFPECTPKSTAMS